MIIEPQEKFMHLAIAHALSSRDHGDYAIGAVVVREGVVLCGSENRTRQDQNPAGHAEILAITCAAKILGRRHMPECILYTTHEPCPMCSASAAFAKLGGIVFGARYEDMRNYVLQHRNSQYLWRTIPISCKKIIQKSGENVEVIGDFLRNECCSLFHS